MNNKTLIILLGLLLFLGGVIALKQYRPFEKAEDTQYRQTGATVAPTAVEAITLTKGPNILSMKKTDKGWEHDGYRLNQAMVMELITGLLQPSEVEVVAESKARYQDFGLTETERAIATATASGTTLTYYLGKADGEARYVVRQNEERVYLIDGIGAQEPRVADWIDATVASFAPETLERIQIEGGKTPIALKQTSDGWLQDGVEKKIDPTSLAQLTEGLQSLTVESLVTDEKKIASLPKNANLTVTVSAKDGATTTYRFWKIGDEYYLSSSERKGIFAVSAGVYTDFGSVSPQPVN